MRAKGYNSQQNLLIRFVLNNRILLLYIEQVDYGVLAACFSVKGDNNSFCIIQAFEPMDSFGVPPNTEYDCPLFTLSSLFRCVSSSSVIESVSFMHKYTSTCIVKKITCITYVEHYPVTLPKPVC